MTCSQRLRIQGKAYPRTCQDCGLGPCKDANLRPPTNAVVCSCPSGDGALRLPCAVHGVKIPPIPAWINAHIQSLSPCTNLREWIEEYGRICYATALAPLGDPMQELADLSQEAGLYVAPIDTSEVKTSKD